MSEVPVDASTLINFLHLNRVDLLGSLAAFDFLVPTEVGVGKVLDKRQRRVLDAALEQGHLAEMQLASTEELGTYAELRDRLGPGESACLALALHRELFVACDDRKAVRTADELLGPDRVLNTPGLLLLSISEGFLSVEEADAAKVLLEKNYFKMTFGSFADLVA